MVDACSEKTWSATGQQGQCGETNVVILPLCFPFKIGHVERTVNLLACSCHTCVDSKSLFESESTAFLGLILTLARKWHEGMPTAITDSRSICAPMNRCRRMCWRTRQLPIPRLLSTVDTSEMDDWVLFLAA